MHMHTSSCRAQAGANNYSPSVSWPFFTLSVHDCPATVVTLCAATAAEAVTHQAIPADPSVWRAVSLHKPADKAYIGILSGVYALARPAANVQSHGANLSMQAISSPKALASGSYVNLHEC